MLTKRKLKQQLEDMKEKSQTAFKMFREELDQLKGDVETLKHARQIEEDQPSLSEQIAEWFDGPKEADA